jgi:hypothetical protein
VDEQLERLRRAHRKDPADEAARRALARALENAGRFDDAWELLEASEGDGARAALADLAARSPRATLARRARLERAASLARKKQARVVALLPWLMPFLTSRDANLMHQGLEAVRRFTHADGPPLGPDLLARLLDGDEGEAA